MTARLDLSALGGYLRTWSATQAFMRARIRSGGPLLDELLPRWGKNAPRFVTWPLALRVGRVP